MKHTFLGDLKSTTNHYCGGARTNLVKIQTESIITESLREFCEKATLVYCLIP